MLLASVGFSWPHAFARRLVTRSTDADTMNRVLLMRHLQMVGLRIARCCNWRSDRQRCQVRRTKLRCRCPAKQPDFDGFCKTLAETILRVCCSILRQPDFQPGGRK